MRIYVRHRLSFRVWNEPGKTPCYWLPTIWRTAYSCHNGKTPCYWLPTIWRTALSCHNGRIWQLCFAWLYLRARIEVVTAGMLEKNSGNRKYDPSDWEEHPSIWWHIWKHLKQVKI